MARKTQSKRAETSTRGGSDMGGSETPDNAVPRKSASPHLTPGLFLAATPIGTAGDVTLRVLDALRDADIIAAEDTRRTQTLMTLHGIDRSGKKMVPYHDHNGASQRPRLLAAISEGQSVVCVSDAGTPLIADPGWRLAKDAIDQGLPVRALPGASALLAALTVSGLPTDRFMFAGFLPPKQAARRAELSTLASVPATLVFYESPRRLAALLADMALTLGMERQAAVSRELTKRHEETRRGTVGELAAHYSETQPRGEIVVSIGPPLPMQASEDDLDEALRKALAQDRVGDAARIVAQRLGLPRREVYNRALVLLEEDIR